MINPKTASPCYLDFYFSRIPFEKMSLRRNTKILAAEIIKLLNPTIVRIYEPLFSYATRGVAMIVNNLHFQSRDCEFEPLQE